jgi:hypothetical protein
MQWVTQYNHTLYLKDGDQFQIEVFNPESAPVLAKISLNGTQISSAGIIVRPGERIFLDRYIDTADRFKFDTYFVNDKNEQVKNAIKSNGEVQIEFFPNWSFRTSNPIKTTPWTIWNDWHNTTGSPVFNTPTTTNFVSTDTTLTGSITTSTYTMDTYSNQIETGRVEHGSSSDQKFKYDNSMNFGNTPFKTVVWKLHPHSVKPIESKDLVQYCHDCGSKVKKQSYKFCPNCGAKLK